MAMSNLTVNRKFLYHQDLMLSEKILLAMVEEAGKEGVLFSPRYLCRALNVSTSRLTVLINNMLKNRYLVDGNDEADPGVISIRILHLGPACKEILESRKINTGPGGTLDEYIPTHTFGDMFENIKEGKDLC